MGIFKSVKLYMTPWMVVRHRSKPNIQRTRIPHWERLKALETCKPMFLPNLKPLAEQCELTNVTVEKELSQFERVLGREILKYMDQSAAMGIYHKNSIKGRENASVKIALLRNDMKMGIYNRYLIRKTLQGTKYEAIIPLFVSHTMMVFCKNTNIDVLLKLQSKMPQYLLLAGIVENRLMSKEELIWYGSQPSLDIVRGQLCGTLTSCASQLTSNLQHHQMQLSQSLSSLAKSDGKDKSEPSS